MNGSVRTAVLALLGAFVLQVLLASHLGIRGVVPNFPLLVVVTLAFFQGASIAAVAGFVSGLMLDLLGAGPVGAWALVLTVVGYSAGMLQANLFAEGWRAPVTVAVVAALVADTSYLVVLTVLRVGPAFWNSILTVVLPRALYNVVLLMLAYPMLARMLRADNTIPSFRRVA